MNQNAMLPWDWINHGHESVGLELIERFYTDMRAVRSQVPKIYHIHEGLTFLAALGAADVTMEAYCLHPMLQADDDLARNWIEVCQTNDINPESILLAMEYRNKANRYLCRPSTDHWRCGDHLRQHVGPLLPEVRHMLLADKWQNRKDFNRHHKATHERSKELTHYFDLWLEYLEFDRALECMRNNKIDTSMFTE